MTQGSWPTPWPLPAAKEAASAAQTPAPAPGDVEWKHFDEIASTQSYVESEYATFAADKVTVVTAAFQSSGRGSGQRAYLMPRDCGVLLTCYFRLPVDLVKADPAACRNAERLLALSTLEVLQALVPALPDGSLQIKWPNDVMLNRRKIGGILGKAVPADPASQSGLLDGAIVGLGLNLNNTKEQLTEIDRPVWPATSLIVEAPSAAPYDIAATRRSIMSAFVEKLGVFMVQGIPPFLDALASRQLLSGMRIHFTDRETGAVYLGRFAGVDRENRIMICADDGTEQRFRYGDVRPPPEVNAEQPPEASAASQITSEGEIEFRHFREIDSTQSFAEEHFKSFSPWKLTAVSADFQTAGRGTSSREWHAARARSVLVSFFFRFPRVCSDHFVFQNLANTTQVLALSAVKVLRRFADGRKELRFGVKWPNDIICEDQKIGGILARAVMPDGRVDGVVIGIGLNINTERADLERIQRPVWPPTSLRAELGEDVELDVASVRAELARTFHADLQEFFRYGFAPFLPALNTAQVLCGRTVDFRVEDDVVQGVFQGLNEQGHILLKEPSGQVKDYPCGEIARVL